MQKTKWVHHSDYPDFPHHNLILNLELVSSYFELGFPKKTIDFPSCSFFFQKTLLTVYWFWPNPLNCTNEFSHALKHAVVSHETLADHVSLTGPADMTSGRFEVFFFFSVLLCVNVLLRKVCMKRPRKGTWRECGGWNNEDCGSTSRKEGNRIESWENSVEFKGWRVYIVYYIFVILHCRFVIELPIFARTIAITASPNLRHHILESDHCNGVCFHHNHWSHGLWRYGI